MLGGRVADLFGRRRMFIVGLVAFSLFSLIAGFAQNVETLVAMRGLQGLAAAFVAPAALSLLTTSFSEGAERNRALGVYGAVLSFGFVAGVISGGVLTDLLDWRWVFFVNVPIGLLAAVFAPGLLVESRGEQRSRHMDIPGAITVTGSVLALVYAVSSAEQNGWLSGQTLGAFALAVVLAVAFTVVEKRSTQPLVPLGVFRRRSLVGANIVYVLIIGAFVGITYVLTLYLQQVKGYSPLQTGLTFGVLGGTAVIAGMAAARIIKRFGIAGPLFFGLVLQAVGTLAIAVLPSDNSLAFIFAGTAVVGFGHVVAVVLITVSGTAGVPDDQQGLAGALLNTSQQVGAALGVAVFAAIASFRTSSLLPDGVSLDAADDGALLSGFRYALVVSGVVAAVAALVGLGVLRPAKDQPENQTESTATASEPVADPAG